MAGMTIYCCPQCEQRLEDEGLGWWCEHCHMTVPDVLLADDDGDDDDHSY